MYLKFERAKKTNKDDFSTSLHFTPPPPPARPLYYKRLCYNCTFTILSGIQPTIIG